MEPSYSGISQVIIDAPSRIHLTLIGMNTGGYRQNGGIGFAIRNPLLKIQCQQSASFRIEDRRNTPLSINGINRLSNVIEQAKIKFSLKSSISVTLTGSMTHYGFGTGTSIRLACLEALFILNNREYIPSEIIQLSGRGGTSGIGINTYFSGGLVFDIGRPGPGILFSPSNANEGRTKLPLVVRQEAMPAWEIGICIPRLINPVPEDVEVQFFHRICPIPSEEVYRTLYHAVYGALGASLEEDIHSFAKSVIALQSTFFKQAERDYYGSPLKELEDALYSCGALAVGMSSIGPTLFFLSEDVRATAELVRALNLECDLIESSTWNDGRRLSVA